MSRIDSDGMLRYDIDNPEDLAALIANGMIWKGGPKAIGLALRALKSGAVPIPNNLPANVVTFLGGESAAVRGSDIREEVQGE